MRNPLRITDEAKLYPITVQPGELVKGYPLAVTALLADAETVASAHADLDDVITAAVGSGRQVVVDIAGPANGVQAAVTVTVHGTLGTVRRVSLLIIGKDPFTDIVPATPDIFLKWCGSYDATRDYAPFNLVLYGGVIYLALKRSIGNAPDIHMDSWMAWAGTGGGQGGGSGLLPDAGGSGRYCAFRMTWVGPGDDDWQVEVKGVAQ